MTLDGRLLRVEDEKRRVAADEVGLEIVMGLMWIGYSICARLDLGTPSD